MVQRGSICLGQEIKGTLFCAQHIHMYCISFMLSRDIRSGGQAPDEVGNSSNAIMHGREELMKLSPRWDLNSDLPLTQRVRREGGGGRRDEGDGRRQGG